MVLEVYKYNLHPDKVEAFNKWGGSAIKRTLATPGLVEMRVYRPVTGTYQIVETYEFADMAAWAAWRANEDVQKLYAESRTFTTDESIELWGPMPSVPAPLRPQK